LSYLGRLPRRGTLYGEIFAKGLGGLKIALIIGEGFVTEYEFEYFDQPPFPVDFNPNRKPSLSCDGDGTVIADSAKWLSTLDPDPSDASKPNPSLFATIPSVDHFGIISHPAMHKWLLSQIPP